MHLGARRTPEKNKGTPGVSGYCRVTVTGPQKWSDLALPGTVPVAALMPQVIEVCAPEEESTEPAAWVLTTIDGERVDPSEPLEGAGIYDGDVLMLERRTAPSRPKHVDDVRGAVEDQVDETAWIWNHRATLTFGLLVAAFGPMLMLGLMMRLHPSSWHMVVTAFGTAFALAVMVYVARRSLPVVAHLLFAAACMWGAVTTLLTVRLLTEANLLALGASTLAGALLVAVVGWALHETGLPYIAGFSVVVLAAGILVIVGVFFEPVQGVRSMALALALCVGVLPRVAMVMGGLSGLDYEVGRSGQVETDRFEDTYRNSDRLLLGIVMGAAASVGMALAFLAYLTQGLPDLLLCGGLSVLLLLRSRLFDRIRHVLPLRMAGVLGLGATGVATIGQYKVLAPWLPLTVLVLGMTMGILSCISLADVPRASLRRFLNWVEILVVITLFPLFSWSMGLFHFVARVSGIG